METGMTRPLTFTLVLSQSAMQAVSEPEGSDPISEHSREVEADPNNATAYLARGIAHLKALDFDSAIADFTKVIELNPNDDGAYTNRGGAHYEKAEFYCAVADLKRALEINPKSALAHSNLGWTYEAMHDERNAIVHYRKALEIDPSLQAARDNLKLLDAPLECEILNWPHELRKDGARLPKRRPAPVV